MNIPVRKSTAAPLKRKNADEGEQNRKHSHNEWPITTSHNRPDVAMSKNLHMTVKKYAFVIDSERYKCGVIGCDHCFPTSSDLDRHIASVHPSDGYVQRYRCPHCNEQTQPMDDDRTKPRRSDIIRHVELHGCNVFCCFGCIKVFPIEVDMHRHLTRCHLTQNFKYSHQQLDCNGQMLKTDDITLVFRCKMCYSFTSNIAQAMEHFKIFHNSATVDFIVIQSSQRTTPKQKIGTSIPPIPAFEMQQQLICAICNSTFGKKENLVAHHQQRHELEPIAIRFGSLFLKNIKSVDCKDMTKMNASFDRQILYTCAHSHATIKYFSEVECVLAHWSNTHETDDQLPFRFQALPLVSCKYCPVLSTFRDLRKHHAKNHPKERFIAVNPADNNQCSVCNFIGDNIVDHFRSEHSLIQQDNVVNPVCLNDATIEKLRQINVRKKCDQCFDIHETENDMKNHYLREHKTTNFERIECDDNHSVQLITGCCRLEVNQPIFFEHFAHHEQHFCCNKCPFYTDDPSRLVDHSVEIHETHCQPKKLEIKNLQSWFWNSEHIFSNGLTLNSYNLIGTAIDDSQRFKEFFRMK
ncbi:PR domain zinc finger protein 5-like isoform X2 [Sitodiplosis mosellana]|uniref:PR domain zinc finger protein 5-like isoform X2 n=1 Tax=Sitodiplosis mosellana TaxID=263140 RepID=UPI0024443526|nr:PR domain zinc finger protein 5-like isoform X2 [Sitodiplosis mosellana]